MHYDAVIVGTGFGGSCAAYALARAGLRTLVLERGGEPHRDEEDWDPRRILIDQRYQSESPVAVRQYGARDYATLYPNEVVGGNSIFYGGASLRLRERDFERWPIGYEALEKHYCEVEQLLGVHGQSGADGCEPRRTEEYPFAPIELAAPAQRLQSAAERIGLQPFRIPLAINFSDENRPICIRCNTCDGFPCKIEAKNEMTTTVLRRAQELGAEVMAGAIADRLEESAGRVRSIRCVNRESKEVFQVSADLFVLGAGALHSPGILLRSGLERFPNSRFIGRFLMRHCNAVVAGVFPFRTNRSNAFHKQLCFTEFYEESREKHGTATGVIQDIYTPAAIAIRHFAPFGVKRLAGAAARYMQNLLCIAEDEPRFENSVRLSAERDAFGLQTVRVDHEYTAADYERRDLLVAQARRVLKAAGALLTRVHEIDTFSHALGTLRCGTSPEDSVLDADCRFWGVDNLYVLDGSCLPASGGVNPSLTIAANALRVAGQIGVELTR